MESRSLIGPTKKKLPDRKGAFFERRKTRPLPHSRDPWGRDLKRGRLSSRQQVAAL